jgi:general stress protein YciG
MKTKKLQENISKSSENISVTEAGRRGGCSTLERHGIEYFRTIGRSGGKRTAELYADLLREFGRLGGRPRRPMLIINSDEGHSQKKEGAVGQSVPHHIDEIIE